jgi:hypothetical protein
MWAHPASALPALALAVCLPGPAPAGAWERAPGASFAALSYNLPEEHESHEGTFSLYFEHGLPMRLTAGLKLDQRPSGPHELDFFLRRNILPQDGALQMAVEVGVAFRLDGYIEPLTGQPVPEVEPGRPSLAIHVGRGFSTPLGGGWWDLRAGLDLPGGAGWQGDAPAVFELDVTVGAGLTERSFATVEVWHDSAPGESFTSLVPGLGLRLTDALAAQLRYVRETRGGAPDSVELGTWLEF